MLKLKNALEAESLLFDNDVATIRSDDKILGH